MDTTCLGLTEIACQNAVWMDYDATCIVARHIRENEIRALCNLAQPWVDDV